MGRDPIRVLPYLTDDYHLSHGLTVAKLENFTWGHRAYIDPARATGANPDLAPTDAESGVAGARFAWLMIQIAPNYQQVARELEYEIVRVFGTDTEATVDVVIGRGLSFRQKFELKREGPGDRWRIDGASQEGVLKTTSYLAFVAFPTEPMMKAVSSALGLDAKTRTSMRSRARRRAARRGEAEQSPTTPQ